MSPYRDEPCPEHVEALDRVLAGEEPTPGLERHLDECASCSRYVGRLHGIEALLREAHDHFDEMEPGALDEKRRPQPAKIAAWAAALLVVAGVTAAVVLEQRRSRKAAHEGPGLVADATPEQGRVILASGLTATILRPDGTSVPVEVGSRVESWNEILVPDDGTLVVRFPSGLSFMAHASSRFVIEEATDARHVVRLEEGSVVFRADSAYSSVNLLVRAGDSTVEPGGRMVAVRAARSTLTEVAAITGTTRILLNSGETLVVREGLSMDVATRSTSRVDEETTRSVAALDLFVRGGFSSTLTVLSDLPSMVSVDGRAVGATPLTVLLSEGLYDVSVIGQAGRTLHSEEVEVVYGREASVVVEAAMADLEAAAGQDEVETGSTHKASTGKLPSSIVARIRKALAEGDTAEALALVEKNYKAKSADPAFLSAAGDTFRRLGRYGDAVDAYLAAATSGKGKAAEKAYLAAARITLEKLRDTGRAELILGAYWKSYPSGFYAQEASFLHARLLVKQKRPAAARKKLETLLGSSPNSYLATKAHLLLGSILITYMSDCASAVPHLKAVQKAAPGGKFAGEAARFLKHCNVQ